MPPSPRWLSVPADRVRWEDVDLAGVMRYSAYTRVVDLAEAELLRAAGVPVGDVADRLGVWLPRRLLRVEYVAPAYFDAPLAADARIARIGTTSLTLAVRIRAADADRVHAEAELVLVCVGRDDFAKRPIPAELVEALRPWTG